MNRVMKPRLVGGALALVVALAVHPAFAEETVAPGSTDVLVQSESSLSEATILEGNIVVQGTVLPGESAEAEAGPAEEAEDAEGESRFHAYAAGLPQTGDVLAPWALVVAGCALGGLGLTLVGVGADGGVDEHESK